MQEPTDITGLLHELARGRRSALDRLMRMVYAEMRRIAHRQLRDERTGHTLNTTALVHETYLKLLDIRRVDWIDRTQFYAVCSRVMRRILIDYARARRREKRGGGVLVAPLREALDVPIQRADDLVALDEALERLETRNERQCRVVEYRYFGGLTVEETAAALAVSPATVKRDWAFCRAWLNRELGDTDGGPADPTERS